MNKKIFLTFLFLPILLFGESNSTKELAQWLKYNFTDGDIRVIAKHIQKIENELANLKNRVKNLEEGFSYQNNLVKSIVKKDEGSCAAKKSIRFKPTLFKLNSLSKIYSNHDKNSKIITTLPRDYKITSYIRYGKWLKISGHFPNKKWESFFDNAWIYEKNVNKIR